MLDVDVVVAGAGPVGLLAAIELTLGGAKVLLLERLAAPSRTIKALGLGALGIEALQRRGMAAALDAEEARNFAALPSNAQGGMQSGKYSGHFGFLFIRRDVQAEPERRMRLVPQQGLESIMTARAEELGIVTHRECTLTDLSERADGLEVGWMSPEGPQRAHCRYLVGCDGGRSTVRKLAGFAFPGTPPTMTLYQGIVDVDESRAQLKPGWHRAAGGVYGFGPFPRRLFMLDFSGPPADRDAPVTREELEGVLRRISGADVGIAAVEVANRWTDNTRLVDSYLRGRVFLAGDAAHIHSPFGGQGLSLGLVDAANLGWKIAAVLRGEASDALLDTYTAERRPVAEAVLANTLAQAAILRPDPQSGAMRDVLARLMDSDDVHRALGAMMSSLGFRYDVGAAGDDAGRLLGDRPVTEADTLYRLMQDGRGVLLDSSVDGEAGRRVATRTDRVRCVPTPAGPSMLIRPDACLAWSGHDLAGLDAAVERWFGGASHTFPPVIASASEAIQG